LFSKDHYLLHCFLNPIPSTGISARLGERTGVHPGYGGGESVACKEVREYEMAAWFLENMIDN
jgi:hypothetical protein